MCHCAHQAGRQSRVQQLQPGLQQGEETDQAVGLGTQMAQIKRHDQNPDQHYIGLSAVVQDGVANDRTAAKDRAYVTHDSQQTLAAEQAG